MSTIVTRAGKGSALTWTEGDNNITNLNNDKIEDIVEDTTPQLGGNLDVNGNSIVSASNGNIAITPNGTGSIVLDGLNWPQADGTADYVLKTNGSGQLSWAAQSAGGISDVVADTTPQLGGDLDINGFKLVSLSNGNIAIEPNGTGKVKLDLHYWPNTDGSNGQFLQTDGTGNLSWGAVSLALDDISGVTLSMPTTGQVLSYNATSGLWVNTTPSSGIANLVEDTTPQLGGDLNLEGNWILSTSNIVLQPDGANDIRLNADTIRVGDTNTTVYVTSNGTGNLVLNTNGGTSSGSLTINHSANGNIEITPDGTGQTVIKNIEYNESIYALGTTGGTIAPNVANGNVQTITLNSALTINAFTSPIAGQSLTLIINGGTAYTAITSTMKFAGGVKTLTGTAGCIDILTVFYDGTTYFASLGKGFA